MKITIHRGTSQIGGCITEIEYNGSKVFIDFGTQLPGYTNKSSIPIQGLTCGDVSHSILLITHYHSDHVGNITQAAQGLPIYMGDTAIKIRSHLETQLTSNPKLVEAEYHKKMMERILSLIPFKALQQIRIGEIIVTPLLVDHSAFDAYMFVVEANNKRILHTGDFRGHGFRSKGLVPTLKKYAKDIDYIISEGTNIQRATTSMPSEQVLQRNFEAEFKKHKYNFVVISSTNIDRIFALYHATKRANRCFICDDYQANLLQIISDNHKQYSSFYNINYGNKSPQGRFIRLSYKPFALSKKLKSYLDNYGFCMLIRSSPAFKPLLEEYATLKETKIYYSLWKGYLDKDNLAFNQSMHDFLAPYTIDYIHTSGHADITTLKKIFDVINPQQGIIPIHTEAPEKFKSLFPTQNIIVLQDGESLNTL